MSHFFLLVADVSTEKIDIFTAPTAVMVSDVAAEELDGGARHFPPSVFVAAAHQGKFFRADDLELAAWIGPADALRERLSVGDLAGGLQVEPAIAAATMLRIARADQTPMQSAVRPDGPETDRGGLIGQGGY